MAGLGAVTAAQALAGMVVVGVDIGTTATKTVAVDAAGRTLATSSAGYRLREPEPGHAVQDPDEILAAVESSVREVVTSVGAGRVAGLCFSAAMHGLLGLDPLGAPVTALVTWADTRAAAQAERLRGVAIGPALHRRTGTP